MKNCTHCKYADWQRTKSGALHPSGDGKCTFEYKVPVLPQSMYWLSDCIPYGGYISRKKELKDHCAYFLREGA